MVLAQKGHQLKLIRFGRAGVKAQVKILNLKKIKHVKNLIMQDIMHKIEILVLCPHVIGHIR